MELKRGSLCKKSKILLKMEWNLLLGAKVYSIFRIKILLFLQTDRLFLLHIFYSVRTFLS